MAFCFSSLQMTENSDAVWNDGVAPELALDFDMPNTSTREALLSCLAAFSTFGLIYKSITYWSGHENPALPQITDCVVPDHAMLPRGRGGKSVPSE